MSKANPSRRVALAKAEPEPFRGFRKLGWNEVVYQGDFVADENSQLKPWEGLSGFRASSFVYPIYRKTATRSVRPLATPSKLTKGSE